MLSRVSCGEDCVKEGEEGVQSASGLVSRFGVLGGVFKNADYIYTASKVDFLAGSEPGKTE